MRPEAVEAMLPFLGVRFANPSGAHAFARDAHRALDEARLTMADLLGADPGDVIFTGGGTEGDNLAVLGVLDRVGGVAVCSAIEHHAVLEPVVERGGRLVSVDAGGGIDLDSLASVVDPTVSVVSVMSVNNEIGVVTRLEEVIDVVRRRAPDAVVHTDAVQAFPWLDVATTTAQADLVSISAHKFGGPKGVGVLVVRDGVELAARNIGGGQERGRRGGTQNVAGIVAMATAASLTVAQRDQVAGRVAAMRDRLVAAVTASVPDVFETGIDSPGIDVAVDGPQLPERVAGIAHLCVDGVESEALLFLLEQSEVYASAGASCSSGAMEPSHVLAAMGVPRDLALGSIRLSLGPETTDAEIDLAAEVIPAAIARLRRLGGRT